MKEIEYYTADRRNTFSKVLGIIALLIVIFSGVAAAQYFQSVSIPSNVNENTQFVVTVTMQQPVSGIFHIVADNSQIIGGGAGVFSGTNDFTCSGLPAGTHTILVELYDGNTNRDYETYTQQITVKGSSIPEFPSVALPAIAILGILFIFGHRKK